MLEETPATPAQAATPGSTEQGKTPAAGDAPGTPGAQPAIGQVTITTAEFAQLQRDAARAKSTAKRNEIRVRTSPTVTADPDDPLSKELEDTRRINIQQAQDLRQERMTNRARDILAKPEYAALPESTKKLILKNPSALSSAEDVEEAILDIEDFVRDEVDGIAKSNQPAAGTTPGHETPPVVTAGNPAKVQATEDIDVSKLSGPARSRAVLSNLTRKTRG